MIESWRPMIGCESSYEISSHGNMRSISRHIERKDGRANLYQGKRLKPQINHNGYHQVNIRINGKYKTCMVHRIVAEAFLEKISGKNFVNHKDGVKANNHVLNLEWVNKNENMKHYQEKIKGTKLASTQELVNALENKSEVYGHTLDHEYYKVKTSLLQKVLKHLKNELNKAF